MTTRHPRRQLLFLFIAIAILALCFGVWSQHNLSSQKSAPLALDTATIFSQPRAISPFQLTDNHDQPFTLANLQGHWSILFFGFTHCPELCPTTLATLNQAYQLLQKDHPDQVLPQVVFISVDPEQDTSQRITTYLSSFNPHFIGATGTPAALDKLTQELSVMYTKTNPLNTNDVDASEYSIDHSGTLLIVNPAGQFYGVFTTPHNANKIAHDIKVIMSASQATKKHS